MELLAPAGNPQSFKAALDAGADAVYLGLPWFNARRPAMNFTPETLRSSLEEAKTKGMKVYITLNTDIKPNEIEDAAKVLTLLEELKVDAVIIKDFGLYYMARECFPNLELHLSTQFGIANSYAAEEAKILGATRVIPARELSFKELELLESTGKDIPEVEAFVQGSMCFSFSGKCLLSSWVGGKSANRGVCQAPCRLKYTHDGDDATFFSMKDLNLVSRLSDLEQSKVSSLKIEGRLKSPGWVGNITSIYSDALKGELDLKSSTEQLLKHSGREMGGGFASGLDHLTAEHSVRFGKLLGKVLDLVTIDGDSFALLDFTIKSPETSLRFVTEDDEFLTIVHESDAIISINDKNQGLLKNIGKIKAGASVYEVIPARNSKSGIGKMRYDVELEVVDQDIVVTVYTDSDKYTEKETYKKIVKAKRGVYPDAIYDKLEHKVVNGWRLNKLYSDDLLLSKTQVNSIVKIISYILAVTILENNPLNKIELSQNVKDFIKKLPEGEVKESISTIRAKVSELHNVKGNSIIIDELTNDPSDIQRVFNLKAKHVVISLFPISFEKDMEELKVLVTTLENRREYIYEINDIGHYNLLKNYLNIPTRRMVAGQGIATYNHLSIKFFKDELGIDSVSIPMEMDSRGVVKITEECNNYADLRFTSLSVVPGMVSRAQSDAYYEGAEFEDKIGTVMKVHKFGDINIFNITEYFSADECRDLEGINFSETIRSQECIDNPSNPTKKFNLERRLY